MADSTAEYETAPVSASPSIEAMQAQSLFTPLQTIKFEDQISAASYGQYRKAIVAAFGVLLVALGLFADNAWTFEDTRTLVETVGVALGIYEVPND